MHGDYGSRACAFLFRNKGENTVTKLLPKLVTFGHAFPASVVVLPLASGGSSLGFIGKFTAYS
jgi:hypothetical protein